MLHFSVSGDRQASGAKYAPDPFLFCAEGARGKVGIFFSPGLHKKHNILGSNSLVVLFVLLIKNTYIKGGLIVSQ